MRVNRPGAQSQPGYTDPVSTDDTNAVSLEGKPQPKRRPGWLRLLVGAAALAVYLAASVALASAFASLTGAKVYHWQSLDVEVRAIPALRGSTQIALTPLGEVWAKTHRAPITLRLRLVSIDVDHLTHLIEQPPRREQIERDLMRTVHADTHDFAIRQVALAALGSLLLPLVLRARRFRWWLVAPLAGAGAVAAALFYTANGYQPAAFENPTYTGSLREARPIIAMARTAVGSARALSDKLRSVAAGVNQLYGRMRVAGIPGDDNNAIHILHVSDIHNNGACLDFIEELATRTPVDAVINTGDLTDLGTQLEAGIARHVGRIPVPYVFVTGNHDSRATVRDVSRWKNAVILDGHPVTVAGLRIAGVPDPASNRNGLGSVDAGPHALAVAANQLAGEVVAPPHVDVVAVHNPEVASLVIGRVPVVLCGHLHHADVTVNRGTVVCNAGTTGGAGIRYFDRPDGVPFTAAILAFSRTAPHRLLYVDQVELSGALGHYSVTRRTFGATPNSVSKDSASSD